MRCALKTLTVHLILYTHIMQFSSSAIDNIAFISDNRVVVTFKGGRDYDYICKDVEGFQNDLNDVISEGESVGRFVNRALRAELLTDVCFMCRDSSVGRAGD